MSGKRIKNKELRRTQKERVCRDRRPRLSEKRKDKIMIEGVDITMCEVLEEKILIRLRKKSLCQSAFPLESLSQAALSFISGS